MQKISKAFGEEASLDEAEEMVEMADADCDGKVSFDEFKALMKEGDDEAPAGDVFVYQSSIRKAGFRSLVAGEEVEVTVVRRERWGQ